MFVALPTISFFCVALLGAFSLGPRIRTEFSQLVLVLWLLLCNLIQGINSLVWAGNTDIHTPRWCDLVTNVLLGFVVAIPGACICVSAKLARVHNDRKGVSEQRLEYLFNGVFCFIVPILYMCLHFIVQDHRFNITENFGCSAATFPANQALVLLLIPPMILGIVAFFFCTRAFHNFSQGFKSFDAHASANTMSSFPDFSRRVWTIMIFGGVMMIITIFGIFIRSPIVDWPSWEAVHKDFSVIAIVKSDSLELASIEFAWWSVSSISWLYIGLSLVLGEDIRDAIRHSPELLSGLVKRFREVEPRLPRKPVLPLHRKPSSAMMAEPTENIVSGWYDMKASTRQSSKSPSPSRTRSPTSTLRSAATSPGSSSQRPALSLKTFDDESLNSPTSRTFSVREPICEERSSSPEDDAFSAATMQYLHSPTAHSLGLQSPIVSPPSVYNSPIRTPVEDVPQWNPSLKLKVPQTIPDDVESTISSIFDAPWPQPPASPLPFTPAYSDTVCGEHDGSFEHVKNYALPFRGPSVHPVPESVRPLNVASRSASPVMKKAKKYLRRGAIQGPPFGSEAVYMTVVQETT